MAFPGASLARAALHVPAAAADAASSLAAKGAELGARTTATGVRTGVRHTSHVLGAFASLASGGRRRLVWAHGGRAHIQTNGLGGGGERHRRYVRALTEALRGLEGVDWAEVNAVTGRVMVTYAEGSVDPDDLVATMHGHVLRSLAADFPHEFTEPRLCILQQPLAGFAAARGFRRRCAR